MSVAVGAALGQAPMCSPAAFAAVAHVGAMPPGDDPYFFLTSGSPASPTIAADFGASISGTSMVVLDRWARRRAPLRCA